MRWKSPVPPSGPPDCESPTDVYVPAVANGRSMRVSRVTVTPSVERRQWKQLNVELNDRFDADPVNVCWSRPYDTNRRV